MERDIKEFFIPEHVGTLYSRLWRMNHVLAASMTLHLALIIACNLLMKLPGINPIKKKIILIILRL